MAPRVPGDVALNMLLDHRTQQLQREKEEKGKLLAEKETLLAKITRMEDELATLRQENQNLRESGNSEGRGQAFMEEIRAGIGELRDAFREQRTRIPVTPLTPVRPIPRHTSTPDLSSSQALMSPLVLSSTSDSINISHQHPDVSLRHVGPEDHAQVRHQSHGQVGRFGCLLFRRVISEDNYRAWAKTTNWDGSRGKHELPQNVKNFVVQSLRTEFPGMDRKDLKYCIDKINEFLRTPRRSSEGPILTLL